MGRPVHLKGLCVGTEVWVVFCQLAEAHTVPEPCVAVQRSWNGDAEATGNWEPPASHPETWPEARGVTDIKNTFCRASRYSSAALVPKHVPSRGAWRKLGSYPNWLLLYSGTWGCLPLRSLPAINRGECACCFEAAEQIWESVKVVGPQRFAPFPLILGLLHGIEDSGNSTKHKVSELIALA